MGLELDMAEREGFEPPETCASIVFKTIALNHSAISPNLENTFGLYAGTRAD